MQDNKLMQEIGAPVYNKLNGQLWQIWAINAENDLPEVINNKLYSLTVDVCLSYSAWKNGCGDWELNNKEQKTHTEIELINHFLQHIYNKE